MPTAYTPILPSSWTVVISPGATISSGIQRRLQLGDRCVGILVPALGHELDLGDPVAVTAVLHGAADAIEVRTVHGREAQQVPGTQQDVAVAEIGQPLGRIDHRGRTHAKQLIAAGAAD